MNLVFLGLINASEWPRSAACRLDPTIMGDKRLTRSFVGELFAFGDKRVFEYMATFFAWIAGGTTVFERDPPPSAEATLLRRGRASSTETASVGTPLSSQWPDHRIHHPPSPV